MIGKIVLGEETGIWFGSVLRGDNELITIGDNSLIGMGATILNAASLVASSSPSSVH